VAGSVGTIWCIYLSATANNVEIDSSNTFVGNSIANTIGIKALAGASVRISNPYFNGLATNIDASGARVDNSGTFSIALHSKTATVTHGLSYTPSAADIGITWTTVGGLLNCTSWSITGISSTEFTVNLYDANGAAKGPSGTVTGSWKSIKTP
jgi:hypothetical protein